MINARHTAIYATVSNALCDGILDYSVGRFNYYRVLFFTASIAMLWQILIGLKTTVTFTLGATPYVIIHGLAIVIGYVFFVKALKYIPLALAGLMETSSLFLTFLIDALLGYISLSIYFAVLVGLFVFSVFLFTDNHNPKTAKGTKTLKPIGFIYMALSILLYLTAPYLVKLSSTAGANEIAINLGYYATAVPYFMYQCLKSKKSATSQSFTSAKILEHVQTSTRARIGAPAKIPTNAKKIQNLNSPLKQPISSSTQQNEPKWWQNFYFLCLVIGSLEALYYVFETMSFIGDTPTVVILIMQMRVFLLFLLSVLFGTDKFTFKKLIALILGTIAVTGVYFS